MDFSGPLTSGATMDCWLLEKQGAGEQAKTSNDQASANTNDYCLPVRKSQREGNKPYTILSVGETDVS